MKMGLSSAGGAPVVSQAATSAASQPKSAILNGGSFQAGEFGAASFRYATCERCASSSAVEGLVVAGRAHRATSPAETASGDAGEIPPWRRAVRLGGRGRPAARPSRSASRASTAFSSAPRDSLADPASGAPRPARASATRFVRSCTWIMRSLASASGRGSREASSTACPAPWRSPSFMRSRPIFAEQIGRQALHARPAVERCERVVGPHRFVATNGVLVTDLAVIRRELHRVASGPSGPPRSFPR